MKKRPKSCLYGRIDRDGRLRLDDTAAFARFCMDLRERDVQLLLEPKAKRRSRLENNYYWGVVIKLLGEELGYTDSEMHEALKYRFLGRNDENTGLRVVKSTAELDTAEFEQYLSEVRVWASENGVPIPLPNEQFF